ncbi:MAG: tetratricopeptide repeat protein, partial [Planctomycetota bacterium]
EEHSESKYAPAARLQLGLSQLAAGRTQEARNTLENVAKTDKQRAQKATYWLARCDMADGNYQAARDRLEALTKAKPKPEKLDAILYDRAVCAMELDNMELAAAEFADLRGQHPNSKLAAHALYREAFCLHKLGRYAESQSLCEKIAEQKDSSLAGPAEELAAENLFLLGEYGKAADRFRKLIEAAEAEGDVGKGLRFNFGLGRCAFFLGDYAEAIRLLEPVAANPRAAQDKRLREAIFLLGDAQLQLGRHDAAAETLAGYLVGKGHRRLEALFKLGLCQLRAGRVAQAETTLGGMIDAPADSPWVAQAIFTYGKMAYRQLHQNDKAAELLEKLLKAETPEELIAPSLYLLGCIDFDAEKYQQASEKFAELVKRFDKHELAVDASLQQAMCAKEMGDHGKAIELLRKFIQTYPKAERVAEARELEGTCLAKDGKFDEAVKAFSALAADKATRTEAVVYELAWAQRSSKAGEAAIKTYRQLLSEYPDGELAAPARTELAELLYLEKKYAEAAALVEKVVSDTNVDAETQAVAHYRLGWCYAELSQPAKAAEAFSDFAVKHPDEPLVPSAMYQAGASYMLIEDYAKAQKSFSALLAEYPDHDVIPVARLKLGECQANAGQYEESAGTYQEFLDKHPDSEFAYLARFGVGWAFENLRKYDQARKWYSKVVKSHNGETAAKAQFHIGECYFAEKNFERAARELLHVADVYGYPVWSARALLETGRAFEALGKLDEAKTRYAECIKQYKDSDSAALAEKRLKALASTEK